MYIYVAHLFTVINIQCCLETNNIMTSAGTIVVRKLKAKLYRYSIDENLQVLYRD